MEEAFAVDVSVIIPAYNETARLEPSLRATADYFRARGRSVEIIVVDDGSLDATSQLVTTVARDYPEVRLIRQAANRGKGYAVRTGVVNARGRVILFTDADGATPIAEIERLDAAIADGAAVAIGSRAVKGAGTQVRARAYRRIMGRGYHKLVSVLTVAGISDTQCGFKMFRHDVAHDLFSRMRMNGFSFDVEVLMMAQRRGYRISEIPVNWEHKPGSKVSLVLDSLRMARDLFIIRARAIRGDYNQPHLAPMPTPALGVPVVDPTRRPLESAGFR